MSIEKAGCTRRFLPHFSTRNAQKRAQTNGERRDRMNEQNLYPLQMPVTPSFPAPPAQQKSAHHGRVENCARRAHDAIMRTDWPSSVYADDVFEPDEEDERLR